MESFRSLFSRVFGRKRKTLRKQGGARRPARLFVEQLEDRTLLSATLLNVVNSTSSSDPPFLGALGDGKVLFTATNSSIGHELYVTDGTTTGTILLKDIDNSSSSSNPTFLGALGNGKVLFT